jgi:hypothetical protein
MDRTPHLRIHEEKCIEANKMLRVRRAGYCGNDMKHKINLQLKNGGTLK